MIKYEKASDREVPEDIKVPLERAYIALNGMEFDEAAMYFDRFLDIEPHFAPAYIGKILCKLKIRDERYLPESRVDFTAFPFWDSANRFATTEELNRYQAYLKNRQIACGSICSQARNEFISCRDNKRLKYNDRIELYERLMDSLKYYDDKDIVDLRTEIENMYRETKSMHSSVLVAIYVFGGIALFVILSIIANKK